MHKNKLTIIIVNWNTSGLLKQCLESLFKSNHISYDVIVVDNGSTDSSVKMVERMFSQVILIKNNVNLGFAKANNTAINKIDTEYVCLLNSDTVASSELFDNMLLFMYDHPDAIACGPALRLPDGKLQTGGAGFELSLSTAFNYFFFLSKLFPFKFRGFYIDQAAYVKSKSPVRVDWLAGACLLVKKSAIDIVGGFDESYFMYAEDAEWCDRLRKIGNIYYLPNLEIIHYHGASSNKYDTVSTKWLEATFKYYYSKYNKMQSQIFIIIVGCGFLLRTLIYLLLSSYDNKWKPKYKEMLRYMMFTIKWTYNQ